jgi:SNF2 family DNA or RNA helicase
MSLKTPFPSFAYHPHQDAGVRWMMSREEHGIYCYGGILADEMGLGKTWQTIGLLLNRPVADTLLLVPPVLHGQWQEVLRQSSIPYTYIDGHKYRKIAPPGSRADIHVVLTTYDRASRKTDELKERYEFQRIVCDEGHVFRNGSSTARFRNLANIPAQNRWLLTGTPVQNRLSDFTHLLQWLDAGYDKQFDTLEVIAEEIMLRRCVADVRDVVKSFPEAKPVHHIHAVTMPGYNLEEDDRDESDVDTQELDVFGTLVQRFTRAVDNRMESWLILELYLRIRQFLAHPQIYKDAMMKKYPPKAEDSEERKDKLWRSSASKMAAFGEFMTTSTKAPTLIFTTFRGEMEFAEDACKKAGYSTWRICGGLGAAGIDAAIQKSKEAAAAGEAVAVLVQIQAGNAGINLQHLHRIVFLSSHWNPAIVDQAVGRAYRIGQTKPVEVHHFLLADGAEKNLDRHMASLHMHKRAVAKTLFAKLECDSAVDVRAVFDELNAVCPDEVDRFGEEEGDDTAPATRATQAVDCGDPE